jgi:hypothetical protein
MVRRLSIGLSVVLSAALLASAATAVTFVLKSGQRASGQLTYHVGSADLGVTSNGNEQMFPFDDIALMQFVVGDPSRDELQQLPTSDNPESQRHMLVRRNGEVVHGKYHGFQEDSITFDVWNNSGGVDRRTYSLGDVARLYLSGSASRNIFSGILNAPAPAPPPPAPPDRDARDRGGRRGNAAIEIHVPGLRPWTDTGLTVNQGERLRFSATGTIKIDRNASTGPQGASGYASRPMYPIPGAPVGSLVGRVGNTVFAIGSRTDPISMPITGPLSLGINDDVFTDNSGEFVVQIIR